MKFSFKSFKEKKTPNCFPAGSFFPCFWRNVYRSILVPWNIPCPETFFGWAPALRHYFFCKTLDLKCLAVFWIRLYLDNCSLVLYSDLTRCTASDAFKILAYSQLFYSGIIRHIQVSSALLSIFTHIKKLRHIQAYSAPSVTLTFSQPCHILSPVVFRTRGIFKSQRNFD